MPRPATQAEYLAGPTPPAGLGRRALLRAAVAGAGLLGATGLAGGCGVEVADGDPVEPATVTFGSARSAAAAKAAMERVVAAFAAPDVRVESNVVDHDAFRTGIDSYLQGLPDDVFTWSAGLTTQIFAQQGLVGDLSEVWQGISGTSEVLRGLSSADGRQYLVPFTFCPWAVFHRPSLFAERGYTPPATFDELLELCRAMRADGLVPLAFADAEGWPAMGTFDQLDLRINGYGHHLALMRGIEPWDSARVRAVFDTWRRLLPFQQADAVGRSWAQAAESLRRREAGMFVTGMFVSHRFTEPADRDDLDLFPFPEVDPAVGTDAVEAPLDGFMLAARPHHDEAARRFLTYLGSPQAAGVYVGVDTSTVAAVAAVDTSGYTALQRRAADLVANRTQIAQFLDRDTHPDFARRVVRPALQEFLLAPDRVDDLLGRMERGKQAIFSS